MANARRKSINAKSKLKLARFGCCLISFKHIYIMVSYGKDFCESGKKITINSFKSLHGLLQLKLLCKKFSLGVLTFMWTTSTTCFPIKLCCCGWSCVLVNKHAYNICVNALYDKSNWYQTTSFKHLGNQSRKRYEHCWRSIKFLRCVLEKEN